MVPATMVTLEIELWEGSVDPWWALLRRNQPLTGQARPAEAPWMATIEVHGDSERRRTDPAVLGTWRITEMELWDRDAFELLGAAHLTFEASAFGHFRFIAVEGDMDCRFSERDGRPLVEFSWIGADENDPASGRGWAVVDGKLMAGRIFKHRGDDSGFTAQRQAAAPAPAKARTGKRPSR